MNFRSNSDWTYLGVKGLDILGNDLLQLLGQLLEVQREASCRSHGHKTDEGKNEEVQLGHCEQRESSPEVTTVLGTQAGDLYGRRGGRYLHTQMLNGRDWQGKFDGLAFVL